MKTGTALGLLCVPLLLGAAAFSRPRGVSVAPAEPKPSPKAGALAQMARLAKLPLEFEANHGQSDKRVRFLSRSTSGDVFFTPTETVFSLRSRAKHGPGKSAVVRMRFDGANRSPKMAGAGVLGGKVNYLIGNDPKAWQTDVPTYKEVRCSQVYSGVDLRYYGTEGKLEYDFIVAPGSDPKQIKVRFNGVKGAEVNAEGNLRLSTASGVMEHQKPVVYQEANGKRTPVPARYALAFQPGSREAEVAFSLGDYDRHRALVIDPVCLYATYLGGNAEDIAWDVAADVDENVYVTGTTVSPNFPTTGNSLRPNWIPNVLPNEDTRYAFVTKINTAGTARVYSTYLGGNKTGPTSVPDLEQRGYGIWVDGFNTAIVVGRTNAVNFPVKNPVHVSTDGDDGFITRLNANGNGLIYSTYFGSDGHDGVLDVVGDNTGDCWITGYVGSGDNPNTPRNEGLTGPGDGLPNGPETQINRGQNNANADAFIGCFNPSGTLLFSTYLGGGGADTGYGIDVDSTGATYVTGGTTSFDNPNTPFVEGLPVVNAFQHDSNGGFGNPSEAFVAKLNGQGNAFDYCSYLGGTGTEQGNGIAVNPDGTAYVVGWTLSKDFRTVSPIQSENAGSLDVFLTRVSANGQSLLFSTYFGGSGPENPLAIILDNNQNVYIGGETYSNDFPQKDTFFSDHRQGFVTRLNRDLDQVDYSSHFGGQFHSGVYGLAITPGGTLYTCGYTDETDFPATSGAIQKTLGGGYDAFVAKIVPTNGAPMTLWTDGSTPSNVKLSFRDPSESETGFAIDRQAGNERWKPLKVIGPMQGIGSVVETIDTTAPGGQLQYRVRTIYAGGAYSEHSNIARFPLPGPLAPTNLTAAAIGATQIDLTWTDNSNDEQQFLLERSGDGKVEVFDLPANTTHYTDAKVKRDTAYSYRVQAGRSPDFSPFSNSVQTIGLATPVSLILQPATVRKGNSSRATVTMSRTVETETTVHLSSSSRKAKVPTEIVIAAGQSTGEFKVRTAKVKRTTEATISAEAGGVTQQAVLKMKK